MMGLEKTVFVNSEKIDTNESLKQAYMELGQAYYEGGFEDPLPQLLPLFDKITRIKKKLRQHQRFGCVRSAGAR